MIAYAIEVAQKSGLFEHVVVSTDDPEIAQVAQDFGAEVPFLRPAELADDCTGTTPVISHVIAACQELGWQLDCVCCIYPCVPLLKAEDLRIGLERLLEKSSSYTFPVTTFPSAIQRALRLMDNGQLEPFYPEYEMTRTQDLEMAYYDVGQFYWGTVEAWLTVAKIHSSSIGLTIPPWRSVDIDTLEDWQQAELLFKLIHNL